MAAYVHILDCLDALMMIQTVTETEAYNYIKITFTDLTLHVYIIVLFLVVLPHIRTGSTSTSIRTGLMC